MEKFRRILKKIFFLPPLPTVIIAIPAFALVIFSLSTEDDSPISYVSYAASTYALILVCTALSHAGDYIKTIRERVCKHPVVEKLLQIPVISRFFKDVRFKTEVSLYMGLFINLLYIVMKLFSGIYYHSFWFIALAIYYILLAFMRFLLLRRGKGRMDGMAGSDGAEGQDDLARLDRPDGEGRTGRERKADGEGTTGREGKADREGRKDRGTGLERTVRPRRTPMEEEIHRYRLCGILLLVMNQALMGIVVYIVQQNRGFEYPGYLIYAMAAYSFYSVITAVINVVKYRRHGSPVISAAKAVNLVAAMVSILSLTTAMLAQFGGDDTSDFRQIMTASVGGSVCTIVIGMAVFMIWRAGNLLKRQHITGSRI